MVRHVIVIREVLLMVFNVIVIKGGWGNFDGI